MNPSDRKSDDAVAEVLREWSSTEPSGGTSLNVQSLKNAARTEYVVSRRILLTSAAMTLCCCLLASLYFYTTTWSRSTSVEDTRSLASNRPAGDATEADVRASLLVIDKENEDLDRELERIRAELYQIKSKHAEVDIASQLPALRNELFYEQAIDQWLAQKQ